ncbi:MAG: hypothetical protein ACKOLA_11380, partial [Spartobacteria bacterium]
MEPAHRLVSSKQATVGFSPFPGWHPAALITPPEFLRLMCAKQAACEKVSSDVADHFYNQNITETCT